MINGVLTTEDLRAATGYSRLGDVRRCLDEQGIPYFWGKDGVWTTTDLVNAAKKPGHGTDAARFSPEMV
jgi:hypothetical protein